MKTIDRLQSLVWSEHSAHFKSMGFRSNLELNLDPYLNIDFFEMKMPVFPPHPHAGFSAVTYMLPESEGSFQNRDSKGDSSIIHPGDIHWTQAGSGILHEEIPSVPGQSCKGFQIFVNLSEKHKKSEPKAYHGSSMLTPVLTIDKSKLRVLAGSFLNRESQLMNLATQVTLIDINVDRHSQLNLELAKNMNWFLFIISGHGTTANHHEIQEKQLAQLSQSGETFQVAAGEHGLRFLLCGGKPINEPVVWGGPFAMTKESEIAEAYNRYRQGQMGTL